MFALTFFFFLVRARGRSFHIYIFWTSEAVTTDILLYSI